MGRAVHKKYEIGLCRGSMSEPTRIIGPFENNLIAYAFAVDMNRRQQKIDRDWSWFIAYAGEMPRRRLPPPYQAEDPYLGI